MHAQAQQKKVWVVPACGFDSIPADITTFLAMQQLTAVEKAEAKVVSRCYSILGGLVSGGTFNTFVEGLSRASSAENREVRRQTKGRFHRYAPQGFALPLPTSDPFVVARSADLLKYPSSAASSERPVAAYYPETLRTEVYAVIPSVWSLAKLIFGILICMARLCDFPWLLRAPTNQCSLITDLGKVFLWQGPFAPPTASWNGPRQDHA